MFAVSFTIETGCNKEVYKVWKFSQIFLKGIYFLSSSYFHSTGIVLYKDFFVWAVSPSISPEDSTSTIAQCNNECENENEELVSECKCEW